MRPVQCVLPVPFRTLYDVRVGRHRGFRAGRPASCLGRPGTSPQRMHAFRTRSGDGWLVRIQSHPRQTWTTASSRRRLPGVYQTGCHERRMRCLLSVSLRWRCSMLPCDRVCCVCAVIQCRGREVVVVIERAVRRRCDHGIVVPGRRWNVRTMIRDTTRMGRARELVVSVGMVECVAARRGRVVVAFGLAWQRKRRRTQRDSSDDCRLPAPASSQWSIRCRHAGHSSDFSLRPARMVEMR